MELFALAWVLLCLIGGRAAAPPQITSTPVVLAQVNNSYAYQVYAGPDTPITYSISGQPSGLTIDAATGLVSGSPTSFGVYGITILATNAQGQASQFFSLTVGVPPSLTGIPPFRAVIPNFYSFSFTVSGFPAPSLALLNAPAWMSVNSTGTISGTPNAANSFPDVQVQATNAFGSNSVVFSLSVGAVPAVSSAPLPVAVVNTPYSFQVSSTGAQSFALVGAPAWLSIDSLGVLGGTPAAPTGTFPFSVNASNSFGSSAVSFSITVNGTIGTLAGSPPPAAINMAYSYTFASGGVPAPSFSISGAPAGMAVSGAILFGTPMAKGTFTLTVNMVNAYGSSAVNVDFVVADPSSPHITSTPVLDAVINSDFFYDVTADGIPSPTITMLSGPSWLQMSGNTLQGMPGPGDDGAIVVVLKASNGVSPDDLQSFVVTVELPSSPLITSVCPGAAVSGRLYACELTAIGNAPISFLGTNLPLWLTIVGQTLSGTPDVPDVGTSAPIIITASNGFLPNDQQSFQIDVSLGSTRAPSSAPTAFLPSSPAFISTPPSSPVSIGSLFYYLIRTTGSPAPFLSIVREDVPSWLRLVGDALTGTPGPGTAGTATILVTASNGVDPDATQIFTVSVVNPPSPPSFTSLPSLSAAVGSLYSYPITLLGSPSSNLSYTGPSFLSLTQTGPFVSLTGTPPTGSEGSFSILILATNGVLPPASQSFDLVVFPAVTLQPTAAPTSPGFAPNITSTPPATARTGIPYFYLVTVTGVPVPVVSVVDLPSWLTFGSNALSGTPPDGLSGAETFRIVASNGFNPPAEQFVTITLNPDVSAAPVITSTPPNSTAQGSNFVYAVQATGSPAPVFLWTLPPWLSSSNELISGVPPAAGIFPISVVASNGIIPAAVQSWTLTVVASNTTRAPTERPTGSVPTAPVIISVAPATVSSGSTYDYMVETLGTPYPVVTTTELPSWLHLVGCCEITGTVPPLASGSVTFTVQANNGVNPPAKQTVTLTFLDSDAPKITSSPVLFVRANTKYLYTVFATGNPAPFVSVSTPLPSWLFWIGGNRLSGTPPSGTLGDVSVSVRAENGVSPAAEQTFTISVSQEYSVPVFLSHMPSRVSAGAVYFYDVVVTGNPTPLLELVGPSWLRLTGTVLNGTAPQQGGSIPLTIRASNAAGVTAQTVSVLVSSRPFLSLRPGGVASVGYVYTYKVQVSGYPAPVLSLSGLSWLTLVGDEVTGSPPAGSPASACFIINATNSVGADSGTVCITIANATGVACDTLAAQLATNIKGLLATTRAACGGLSPEVSEPANSCHRQCDIPVALKTDVFVHTASRRRLLSRSLLALSSSEQTAIAQSAQDQWGLTGPNAVTTMSVVSLEGREDVQMMVLVSAGRTLNTLPSVDGKAVDSMQSVAASQTDLLAFIQKMVGADLVPTQGGLQQGSLTVTADTQWYVWVIVMLLVVLAICWILLLCAWCRRRTPPEKARSPVGEKPERGRPVVEGARRARRASPGRNPERDRLEEEERAVRAELSRYQLEVESLRVQLARDAAIQREHEKQVEQQAEISRLLKQMVELEALQGRQHEEKVAALKGEIAGLRKAAAERPVPDAKQLLAQAQQHDELQRLNEEYQKLKADRALLQAEDLKSQKKLLDTVDGLTRALDKSRTEAEDLRSALAEETRRLAASERNKRELENERQREERYARERDERLAQERQQREIAERLALERQQLAQERQQREMSERERQGQQERQQQERQQREMMERERVARERQQRDMLEQQEIVAERERLERERLRLAEEREQLERARIQKEEGEKLRLAKDREELEKERERIRRNKEREQLEQERERLAIEKQRLDRERAEQEKQDNERAERERADREKLEKQRDDKERFEREKEAIEKERLRLAKDRERAEQKRHLEEEKDRIQKEREQLARDREALLKQHEERNKPRSPRAVSPASPGSPGSSSPQFSDDSGVEDNSGGSDGEPQPMHFPKGPGLQDSDDEMDRATRYRTISHAQGGVFEQWKQREAAAREARAKEKRQAARRLARRQARHQARREARAARAAASSPPAEG